MHAITRDGTRLLSMLAAFAYAGFAPAAYVFNSIDYPGASFTQVFGINNNGNIAIATDTGSFTYQSAVFTPIADPRAGLFASALGINDSSAVVGSVADETGAPQRGFILNGGAYQFFAQPGWTNTQARAIGNGGLIAGYSWNNDGFNADDSVGFLYDPVGSTFTAIAPDPTVAGYTIAQGINAAGQVVGSYGQGGGALTAFLRQPDGSLITFRINGYRSAARGINDAGLITGWVDTDAGQRAFVGTSAGFELLQCPPEACPGVVETYAEGINDDAQIAGSWVDASSKTHGFIATPASIPTGSTTGGAYTFDVSVVPNVTIYIDPAASLGFDYETGSGDPKFASVRLPIGVGDNRYTLIVHGQTFALAGGDRFDFAAHGFTKGVAQFRVAGIEASAALDPANPVAFPTGLTFSGAGTFTGTMTPLCRSATQPINASTPEGRGLTPCAQ